MNGKRNSKGIKEVLTNIKIIYQISSVNKNTSSEPQEIISRPPSTSEFKITKPIIICSDKLINLLETDIDNIYAQEHSEKTFKDLKIQLENLKIKLFEREEEFIKQTTIMKGLHKNNQKFAIKLVYKFPEVIKNYEKKIQLYSDLKEKSTIPEEKSRYASNCIKYEIKKKEIEDILKNEKNISSMRHKNCLRITWFGDFFNHYVYLSEYCSNRDLGRLVKLFENHKFLQINKSIMNLPWLTYFSENLIKFFVTQILSGLQVFKNSKCVHGNLSLDNILITNNFQIKITDFVCSKFFHGSEIFKITKNEHEVNLDIQPPEYFRPDKFVESRDSHKIDVFALGCAIFTMVTNKFLFEENKKKKDTDSAHIEVILKQIRKMPELLEEYPKIKRSPEFVKTLQRMLEPFEKGRISLDELTNSAWIKTNSLNLKNIECVYQNDPTKMITEMIKADHVSIYNNTQLEKEVSYFKTDNPKLHKEARYHNINILNNMQKDIKKTFITNNKTNRSRIIFLSNYFRHSNK